jgi:hypothetical protein
MSNQQQIELIKALHTFALRVSEGNNVNSEETKILPEIVTILQQTLIPNILD